MAEILEAVMLVCFGLSWPMNAYKNYKARTAAGASWQFILLITLGYVAGIAAKFVSFSELGVSGLLHQLGVHRRELGGLRAQPQARRPSFPRTLCVRIAPRSASTFERALWPVSSGAQDAHGAACDAFSPVVSPSRAALAHRREPALRPSSSSLKPRPSRSRPLVPRSPRALFCPSSPRPACARRFVAPRECDSEKNSRYRLDAGGHVRKKCLTWDFVENVI